LNYIEEKNDSKWKKIDIKKLISENKKKQDIINLDWKVKLKRINFLWKS